MPPKRTAPSEGEQKHDAKVVKQQLRRSGRLEKHALLAAAAKEESKPQKRARKSSPKPKKQPKGKEKEKKMTKEDVAAPAQNGETKPDEIHVSRPSVSVTSARGTPPSSLSVKGQVETVAVKGTEN